MVISDRPPLEGSNLIVGCKDGCTILVSASAHSARDSDNITKNIADRSKFVGALAGGQSIGEEAEDQLEKNAYIGPTARRIHLKREQLCVGGADYAWPSRPECQTQALGGIESGRDQGASLRRECWIQVSFPPPFFYNFPFYV